MRIHILVADDDSNIRELLKFTLQQEGFIVFEAGDGIEGADVMEQEIIHLAVVDVMMPNKDGLELCTEIRQYYDIPVILLTAKGELKDKAKGFSSGTDDYLVKPFEPSELIFRIKALLRRYQTVSADKIQLGQTVIDRKGYKVSTNGDPVSLPLKEFELLSQLASHPGQIFTREQLLQQIWGSGYEGDSRTIDVHIKRLRERFSHAVQDFTIATVRGIGYKLEISGVSV